MKKIENIAKVGCIVYLFPIALNVILSALYGNVSIVGIVTTLLLIVGIGCFPNTIIDYDSAKMAKGNVGKIVIAIVMVFLISSAIMNGGSGGSGNTCEYCNRTFTDSANLKSISRTNMCTNCSGNYKDLSNWLDDMNNK